MTLILLASGVSCPETGAVASSPWLSSHFPGVSAPGCLAKALRRVGRVLLPSASPSPALWGLHSGGSQPWPITCTGWCGIDSRTCQHPTSSDSGFYTLKHSSIIYTNLSSHTLTHISTYMHLARTLTQVAHIYTLLNIHRSFTQY